MVMISNMAQQSINEMIEIPETGKADNHLVN